MLIYLQLPGLQGGKLILYAVLRSSSDILSKLLFKAHSQALFSRTALAGIRLLNAANQKVGGLQSEYWRTC